MTTRLADPDTANGHPTYPSLLGAAEKHTRPARTRARGRTRAAITRATAAVRPLLLSITGLAALDAALWELPIGPWSTVAGLAGIGIAGLLLDRQVHG